MKSVDLNSKWSIAAGEAQYVCDLPHDVTADCARDYSCAFGELNGYIPAARAVMTHDLPQIKDGSAALVISGACGYGEIYVNDEQIGTLCSYSPVTFYLGDMLSGMHNSLRLELFNTPGMSDKYTGLGVAGGVKLVVLDSVTDIELQSLFVKTATDGGRTYADAEFGVYNNGDSPVKLVAECVALNARGKRAGKKQRKIYLRAHQTKTVSVRVRITNPYEWTPSDPYMYTMTAKITAGDNEKSDSVRFGIVSRSLNSARGLYINDRNTVLRGAYISHADCALGSSSLYVNEKRRLLALKDLGYNAVHYVECPTEAALDACDDTGMYAFVDLFSHLVTGKAPLDSILIDYSVSDKVKALRNHPSVTMYGVADNVPECYGRNGGHELIASIARAIKGMDDTRPVTVSAQEEVPTVKEFEAAGYRKLVYDSPSAAINAGREKNLFDKLTAGAFDSVDVCGFNYLYPLYETEKSKRNRLIVGARTKSDRAFESLDAAVKNDKVIGDFNDCGIDYPGGGKFGRICFDEGDLDAICCKKPQAVYKSILLGKRNVVYITAEDPETKEPTHLWNWTRYLGQKIKIRVYTSGDVVALYLDGRLVGRKLAGKINKHIATFDVDYYPGKLEAVAYFKGVECARSVLKSAGSPKTLRLTAFEKNLSVSRGDVGFVRVEVCDRDGELVPYAMRELNATVTGGTLVSFINADSALRKNSPDTCPAYNGAALAVVKPDPFENKMTVKITGDGLLASRISFKIKN